MASGTPFACGEWTNAPNREWGFHYDAPLSNPRPMLASECCPSKTTSLAVSGGRKRTTEPRMGFNMNSRGPTPGICILERCAPGKPISSAKISSTQRMEHQSQSANISDPESNRRIHVRPLPRINRIQQREVYRKRFPDG